MMIMLMFSWQCSWQSFCTILFPSPFAPSPRRRAPINASSKCLPPSPPFLQRHGSINVLRVFFPSSFPPSPQRCVCLLHSTIFATSNANFSTKHLHSPTSTSTFVCGSNANQCFIQTCSFYHRQLPRVNQYFNAKHLHFTFFPCHVTRQSIFH